MKTDYSKLCAFCKYFTEKEEDLWGDINSRCELTGKFTNEENTCNNHLHKYKDDTFFTDINDDD